MRVLLTRIALSYSPSGGMEHVASDMANWLADQGNQVIIGYYDNNNQGLFYPVSPEVVKVNLDELSEDKSVFNFRQKAIREALRTFSKEKAKEWKRQCESRFFKEPIEKVIDQYTPDVIISFDIMTTALYLKAMNNRNSIPLITMFHFPAKQTVNNKNFWQIEALKKSSAIQVLLESDKNYLEKIIPGANIWCIPNAVKQCKKTAELGIAKPEFRIIHAGRFSRRIKRQHLLLEAFLSLADKYPNWELCFWGEGESKYRAEMSRRAKEQGLQERVHFCGLTKNLEEECTKSDLFVFPSLYEGFGMAMAEAMSAGLPVVAYRSCAAAAELIQNGADGLLVDDGVSSLAKGMDRFMGSQKLRSEMGGTGP